MGIPAASAVCHLCTISAPSHICTRDVWCATATHRDNEGLRESALGVTKHEAGLADTCCPERIICAAVSGCQRSKRAQQGPLTPPNPTHTQGRTHTDTRTYMRTRMHTNKHTHIHLPATVCIHMASSGGRCPEGGGGSSNRRGKKTHHCLL